MQGSESNSEHERKVKEVETQKGGTSNKRKRNSSPTTEMIQTKPASSKPPSSRPNTPKKFKSKVSIYLCH